MLRRVPIRKYSANRSFNSGTLAMGLEVSWFVNSAGRNSVYRVTKRISVVSSTEPSPNWSASRANAPGTPPYRLQSRTSATLGNLQNGG
jgi:hypothetical protein